MNYPQRFSDAIDKLYHAFQSNKLIPECACQCAVGTILDRKDYWKHFSHDHGTIQLNYIGTVHQKVGRRYNGYTPLELLRIEAAFLKGCGYKVPLNHKNNRPQVNINNDALFCGLTAVVQELCNIERLPNVMDCKVLFAYEKNVTSPAHA